MVPALNPSLIWVVQPELFEDNTSTANSMSSISYRKEKASTLISLLSEAHKKGIPVGVTPATCYQKLEELSNTIRPQIHHACKPLYGTKKICNTLKHIKQGIVLLCGCYLRHGWLDSDDETLLPKNYLPVQLPENFSHSVISPDARELIPVEAGIAAAVHRVNRINKRYGTSLEAVVDSRITLPMIDLPENIFEDSFYRAEIYLRAGFLASVEKTYPVL